MDAFKLKEEEWLTYLECLEMVYVVNNVPEDAKVASLLTLMDVCFVKKFNDPD